MHLLIKYFTHSFLSPNVGPQFGSSSSGRYLRWRRPRHIWCSFPPVGCTDRALGPRSPLGSFQPQDFWDDVIQALGSQSLSHTWSAPTRSTLILYLIKASYIKIWLPLVINTKILIAEYYRINDAVLTKAGRRSQSPVKIRLRPDLLGPDTLSSLSGINSKDMQT